MSNLKKNNYDLEKETTNDIIEGEKTSVDEIETGQSFKIDETKSYKNQQEKFLNKLKSNEKEQDLMDIKKMQMQMFASASSEYYSISSKHSFVFEILAIIVGIFLVVVAGFALFFNVSQYKIFQYERIDLEPMYMEGTVFMCDLDHRTISEDDVGKLLYYELSGVKVLRIIESFDKDTSLITVKDGYGNIDPPFIQGSRPILGIANPLGSFGIVMLMFADYGYYFCGGLLLVMVVLLIIRSVLNRKASQKLMDQIDIEREKMDKRRKELAESILKMQENSSSSYDNMDILSNLLLVQKSDKKMEKRLEKIHKQLTERQREKVEKIKGQNTENEKQKEIKDSEEQVINFVRNEIKKNEMERGLKQEEIEKRLKEAEETNKNI